MDKNDKSFLKRKEDVRRQWFVFDAEGKTLGRLASEIAKVLRGKHRPDFTPHIDSGDAVIVINADKVTLTGSKKARKVYRYYTGHMSGLREVPYQTMAGRHPTYPVEHAIKGMMPKTRLSRRQLKRLRVFAGSEHNMQAQEPVAVNC